MKGLDAEQLMGPVLKEEATKFVSVCEPAGLLWTMRWIGVHVYVELGLRLLLRNARDLGCPEDPYAQQREINKRDQLRRGFVRQPPIERRFALSATRLWLEICLDLNGLRQVRLGRIGNEIDACVSAH